MYSVHCTLYTVHIVHCILYTQRIQYMPFSAPDDPDQSEMRIFKSYLTRLQTTIHRIVYSLSRNAPLLF